MSFSLCFVFSVPPFLPVRRLCSLYQTSGKNSVHSKAWTRSQPGIQLVLLYKCSYCFGAKLRAAQETEICTAVHKSFREEAAHESQAWPAVNLASATLKVTVLFTSELLSSGNAIFGSLIGSASYVFFLCRVKMGMFRDLDEGRQIWQSSDPGCVCAANKLLCFLRCEPAHSGSSSFLKFLCQAPQDRTVKVHINSLTLGNQLTMHNPVGGKWDLSECFLTWSAALSLGKFGLHCESI